ncbi:MAG: hypothetical protein ACP5O0_06185 [Acidimicrobiales bacterium]
MTIHRRFASVTFFGCAIRSLSSLDRGRAERNARSTEQLIARINGSGPVLGRGALRRYGMAASVSSPGRASLTVRSGMIGV